MKLLLHTSLSFMLGLTALSTHAQSTILWHRSYDSGTSDEGKHVSVNSQGSVFVAGLNTFGNSQNVLSLKYDSTGTLVFAYKCSPELPGNLVKIERAVNANIYALSSVALSGGDNAYSISKYTPSATFRFQYNSGDSINYRFLPVDIAVDVAENVLVAGTFEEYVNQSKSGFFIKQISSTGTDKWTKTYTGTGITQLTDMVIDNNSNVYVCGVQGLTASAGDFVLQKYNANGVLQWTKTYNGTANLLDKCEKIAVDKVTGNVYVSGTTNYNGSAAQSDNALVKYNSAGVRQWQKIYGHTGKNSALEILFDATGNAYVVGNALDVNNSSGSQPNRIFTVKFSSGGTQQWIKIHNNGNYIHEYAKSAVSDNSGNIYVGAEVKDSASFVSDMLAYKLSNAGVKRWEQRGDGLAGENDFVSAIVKDNLNNVYVTGRNGNASYDVRTTRIADKLVTCGAGFTQICYLNKTRCVATADLATYTSKGATLGACIGLRKSDDEPSTLFESSVYPNPSASTFTLILEENLSAEISLIDLTGRELLHEKNVPAKFVFGNELTKGIYLLKITTPSESKIVKLIKSE
ncbi:MAG: T9SS type A sorting domain-containing protein [Bacteroidetes bacterium]|nr:T9SS type A sorting domain-containing protein [Bacteroidota bacterium]